MATWKTPSSIALSTSTWWALTRSPEPLSRSSPRKWEFLDSGLTYRFQLQEGVQFHRGWGELKAQDVVHTHDQLIREDSRHSQASSWRRDVALVEAKSDYVVEFRLNQPMAGFLNAVGEGQSLLPIQSSTHFQADGEPSDAASLFISGTGPYQMLQRQVGSRILVERPRKPTGG